MTYKDKEKMLAYKRKYYREYYKKIKPGTVKSGSIRHGALLIQYHKIVKTKADFISWMCRIKDDQNKLVETLI